MSTTLAPAAPQSCGTTDIPVPGPRPRQPHHGDARTLARRGGTGGRPSRRARRERAAAGALVGVERARPAPSPAPAGPRRC